MAKSYGILYTAAAGAITIPVKASNNVLARGARS
jgi:hypothetical protein